MLYVEMPETVTPDTETVPEADTEETDEAEAETEETTEFYIPTPGGLRGL
jgi:hypothetical protein